MTCKGRSGVTSLYVHRLSITQLRDCDAYCRSIAFAFSSLFYLRCTRLPWRQLPITAWLAGLCPGSGLNTPLHNRLWLGEAECWTHSAAEHKQGRVRGDKSCTNAKPNHDFPILVKTKFCSICHRLAVISISIYGPNSNHPFGIRVLESRKCYQSKCRPHFLIRSLLAPFWPNAHLMYRPTALVA